MNDKSTAISLLRTKANAGDIEAQYQLARIYSGFESGEEYFNILEAQKWYESAALAGHVDAQFELAELYWNVDIQLPELEKEKKANEWYQKAFEGYSNKANQGDSHSQFKIGEMYLLGLGVKKDLNEAIRCMEKVAINGAPLEKYKYAKIILFGKEYGINIEPDKARRLLEDSAENGCELAQYDLGRRYEDGDEYIDDDLVFSCDEKKAAEFYEQATKKDYAPAFHRLASMCFTGKGVRKNLKKGRELLISAANKGDIAAIYTLAICYENGEYGFPKDVLKAKSLRQEAEN